MLKKLKNLKKYTSDVIFAICLVMLAYVIMQGRTSQKSKDVTTDTIKIIIKDYKDSIKLKRDSIEVIKLEYV